MPSLYEGILFYSIILEAAYYKFCVHLHTNLKMGMDRNSVIGFVLLALLFFGYFYYSQTRPNGR